MSGHTPGPWWYQEKSDAYTHIVRSGESRFLCQLAQDTSGEAEANARLIAAAPETAAELERVREINAELVEALRFYAAEGNWEWDRAPDPAGTPIPGTAPTDIDHGAKAIAAIARAETSQ